MKRSESIEVQNVLANYLYHSLNWFVGKTLTEKLQQDMIVTLQNALEKFCDPPEYNVTAKINPDTGVVEVQINPKIEAVNVEVVL